MDQFAVAFGEKDKALMLNCDTLEYKAVDTNLGDYVLAIINTNKPRKLAESKYNERVQECQAALKAFNRNLISSTFAISIARPLNNTSI